MVQFVTYPSECRNYCVWSRQTMDCFVKTSVRSTLDHLAAVLTVKYIVITKFRSTLDHLDAVLNIILL